MPSEHNIAAPFGGLQAEASLRDANPHNAIDCLNTITSDGNVALRPGTLLVGGDRGFDYGAVKLQEVALGGVPYLYAFDQGPSSGQHFLLNANMNAYVAPAAIADVPDVVESGNMLLCVAGTPAQARKLYAPYGSLTDARLGIVAPSGAPPVALIAGSLTGTYSYRITWYNSFTGTESGPSLESSISPVGQGVRITLASSADTQVTHRRIYRKKSGTDSTWYLLDTFAGASYDDDGSVSVDRSPDGELNFIAGVPPTSHVACEHRGYVFYKDETGGPYGTSVRRSEFARPEQVYASSTHRFGGGGRDYLVALRSFGGALWGLNRDSIWAVTGYDRASFVTANVLRGVGCIAKESVVEHEGWLYWLAATGVYRFNGNQLECISQPDNGAASSLGEMSRWIRPFDMPYCTAAFEPLTQSYVLNAQDPGSAGGFHQLVWHIRNRAWQRWKIGASALGTFAADYWGRRMFLATWAPSRDSFTHRRPAIFGKPASVSNAVYGDYDGSSTPWAWQTPRLTLGTTRRKRFYFGAAKWSGGRSGATITLQQSIDGGAAATIKTAQQDRADKRLIGPMGSRGDDVSLRIEATGPASAAVEVQAIAVLVDPIGWR